MSLFKSALCVAIWLLSIGNAPATVLVNGGFEQLTTSGDLFIPAGDPSLVGWAIVTGSVDVVSNTGSWPAFAGAQSLDLDGHSGGTIEQVFATTVGATYVLSFEYANKPSGLPSANVVVLGRPHCSVKTISHLRLVRANIPKNQIQECKHIAGQFANDGDELSLVLKHFAGVSRFDNRIVMRA